MTSLAVIFISADGALLIELVTMREPPSIINFSERVTVMPSGFNRLSLSLASKATFFICRFFALTSTCPPPRLAGEAEVKIFPPSRTISPSGAKMLTLPVFPLAKVLEATAVSILSVIRMSPWVLDSSTLPASPVSLENEERFTRLVISILFIARKVILPELPAP